MKLYHKKYYTSSVGGINRSKEFLPESKRGKVVYLLNQALIWFVIIALFVAVVKKIYLGHLL